MNPKDFNWISLSKGCQQLLKRERLKALVWFWLIDETYWTNPMLKCVDKLGWSNPNGGARWWSWRWWWPQDVDQALHIWKRRKRKTKMGLRQRYNHRSHFCFGDQNIIKSVITFKIDSRTIKRGESRLMRLSSATRWVHTCICIRT